MIRVTVRTLSMRNEGVLLITKKKCGLSGYYRRNKEGNTWLNHTHKNIPITVLGVAIDYANYMKFVPIYEDVCYIGQNKKKEEKERFFFLFLNEES